MDANMVQHEALIVGMALVPGLLSRNRSFALFEEPEVRRARRRAALLRGIVRHLSGMQGPIESLSVVRSDGGCELSYIVPGMKMRRRATLSELEFACVRHLASRAGVAQLPSSDADRLTIDAALQRLAAGLRLADLG